MRGNIYLSPPFLPALGMHSNSLCSTMPQSMRKQSANKHGRLRKGIDEQQNRKKALNLLQEKRSIRYVADACSIFKSTAGRIALCLKNDDKAQISRLLNPVDFHRGRRNVWHASGATQLNKKIREAAENGFAVDTSGMKFVLQQICNDGRRSYQYGAPSSAAIRTYRAKNRDITYRRTENKDAAKLRAENHDHIESLAHRLREIATNHGGIFDNPLPIWNLDEMHVDGEFGERVKVFSGSRSHHGGFTAVQKGSGRHMTAVIAAAASGHLAPLFLIAAGVNVMQSSIKLVVSPALKFFTFERKSRDQTLASSHNANTPRPFPTSTHSCKIISIHPRREPTTTYTTTSATSAPLRIQSQSLLVYRH